MQEGKIDKALARCDEVVRDILPYYDKKDCIGIYTILFYLIRVMKWNGELDKARGVYHQFAPEGIEHHFAVGSLHKPICLLLKIADGSSEEYDVDPEDIELALAFNMSDMTDNNYTRLVCLA